MGSKIGQAIKEIREENNWTLEEMAQKLGTTKQALSRYERGERVPKISVANDFAKKLGVPLNVLAGEEPEPEGKMILGFKPMPIHPDIFKMLEARANPIPQQIIDEDKEMIDLWSHAKSEARKAALAVLRSMDDRKNK